MPLCFCSMPLEAPIKTPLSSARDGAQVKCHSCDEPHSDIWHCLLQGTPTPAAVCGDEPESQSCSLNMPTILQYRKGCLLAAGVSSARQIYLLHKVRAATAVILYLCTRAFLCPALLYVFIQCHILKLHKGLARWRKQLLPLGLTESSIKHCKVSGR